MDTVRAQVSGVEISENYLPVVHDITCIILMFIFIVFGLKAKIVDVETAFPYSNIEEEIFMECPPEITSAEDDDVLALNKSIHGLVQAASQYHEKAFELCGKLVSMVEKLTSVCSGNNMKRELSVWQYMWMTTMGYLKAIEYTIEQLKKNGFVVKVEDGLRDYLSCEIRFKSDRKETW